MLYKITNFINNIKHFIKWSPIIWEDRDWDENYLYKMISFKLGNMKEYHEKYGVTADRLKIAKQINTCKLSLDRVIKDTYWPFELFCDNREEHKNKDKPLGSLFRHEVYLKKQDLELFAKYFVKYSRGWWD